MAIVSDKLMNEIWNYAEEDYLKSKEAEKEVVEAKKEAVVEELSELELLKSEIQSLKLEIQLLRNELDCWKRNQTGRKPTLSNDDIDFMHKQRLAGKSYRSIAKLKGVSDFTVRKYLRKNKL